jgi:hypothetical protein
MDIMSEVEIDITACTFQVGYALLQRRGGTKDLPCCNHPRCAKGKIVRWAGPFRVCFTIHQVYHSFPFPIRLVISVPSIPHLPQTTGALRL